MNKQYQVLLRAFNENGQKFDLEILDDGDRITVIQDIAVAVLDVARHRIVGMENWAPSLMPLGQREVMVLVRV